MKNINNQASEQEMIVFRVPKHLALHAQKKASVMMISKSAICRTALLEYLTKDKGNFPAEALPQF